MSYIFRGAAHSDFHSCLLRGKPVSPDLDGADSDLRQSSLKYPRLNNLTTTNTDIEKLTILKLERVTLGSRKNSKFTAYFNQLIIVRKHDVINIKLPLELLIERLIREYKVINVATLNTTDSQSLSA